MKASLRPQRWAATFCGVVIATVATSAGAVPQQLQTEVYELEQQARTLSLRFKTDGSPKQQLAEHRLVDAQVLYNLQDYSRAAILLLDYIHKYPNTRGYPEALYFLADSLYQKRDFLSARRYFRKIVNEVKGPRYQEALQRLVELALRTNDNTDVKTYLGLLANIPAHEMKPSVPYVIGKYHFFAGQTDAALDAFRGLKPANQYYMSAQYFIGAGYVRKRQLSDALKVFESLLKAQPQTARDKHIRDLTLLAVGRLLYQSNKVSEAIDSYQKVSRRSKEFDAALYEIAWAYIKAGKLKQSLRALDLLVLAQPNSPFVPEVQVLQGNLLIRLKSWGRATDLFTQTRDRFMPVQGRMKQLLDEQSDPNVFFDVLLARNLGSGSLAVAVDVPELAVHWVKERDDVKRAMHLVKDVRDIRENIDDAKRLIRRLESAVNSPAKIRIFPDFATAKRNAVEVENRTTHARRQLLEREYQLVRSMANPSEREELDRLTASRRAVEQQVAKLPASRAAFAARTAAQVKRTEELERRISRLGVTVQSLKAQLIAAEKYFFDTAGKRSAPVRQSFQNEANRVRGELKLLEGELEELKLLLADARRTAGVGGAEEVAEAATKEHYRRVAGSEHALLTKLRERLTGSAAIEFDTLSGLYGRCDGIDAAVAAFTKRLNEGVDNKLATIRAAIAEEKGRVSRYDGEETGYRGETNTVAGTITYAGFRAVAKRFYDIVVRSEVGVIDVAWALKDAKSKEVSGLVRQRKMDTKLLDEEFKEVLKN